MGVTEALEGIKILKGVRSLFEKILIENPQTLSKIVILIQEVQKAKLRFNKTKAVLRHNQSLNDEKKNEAARESTVRFSW